MSGASESMIVWENKGEEQTKFKAYSQEMI